MKLYRDYFRAFRVYHVVVEFTRRELKTAKLTPEEKALLRIKPQNIHEELQHLQILAEGIKRRQQKEERK